MRFYFVVLIAAVGIVSQAHARLEASWKPLTEPSTPQACDGFPSDEMLLTVSDGVGHPMTDYFCSFTTPKVNVFSDDHGRNYVLVEYGLGHGTNATTYYLSIYRVDYDQVNAIVGGILLGWSTGPAQRFTYTYTLHNSPAGGLELILSGAADKGSVCCVPHEKTRTIRIEDSK